MGSRRDPAVIVLPGKTPAAPLLEVRPLTFRPDDRRGVYGNVRIHAGIPRFERVAFDGRPLPDWPVNVEVTVSPTGRSVDVYVNGKRVVL